MIDEQIPNFFRPWVNPFVAQTSYCLTRLVSEMCDVAPDPDSYQAFLANSGDEALSGALKLARYATNITKSTGRGLIVDEAGCYAHTVRLCLRDQGNIDLVPNIELAINLREAVERLEDEKSHYQFVVIAASRLCESDSPLVRALRDRSAASGGPLLIVSANQAPLNIGCRTLKPTPDIVIFDDAWVQRDLPFGAFVATKRLYRLWNRRGMTTFHSTTFQPNSISTLHFMSCLRSTCPEFVERHQPELSRIESDPVFRKKVFANLYSRSLSRLAQICRFDGTGVRASGHFITRGQQPSVLDGVAGVACSVRGHNPSSYLAEIDSLDTSRSYRQELNERLHKLTGLPHLVPAVSGATAVENALKIGLACQYPRQYVLALQGGFGGKTLLALTGTAKESLKAGLAPLYPYVIYIDPFCQDAAAAIENAFRKYPIGIVQLELIQGVGGVRAIPINVIQYLSELRKSTDFLLFVDEVQTGMFRTGPFLRSELVGIRPDLLSIGKGTSDMLFPFAITMYSDHVEEKLQDRSCNLTHVIDSRYGYEMGFRTVVNTLRRAEMVNLSDRVRDRGELLAQRLRYELERCPSVLQVRCFGLLVGIELDFATASRRWFRKLLAQCYLLAMLNHRESPLLLGFCQYEPHVLKLTPSLSITREEVLGICSTISAALHQPAWKVALSGLRQLI